MFWKKRIHFLLIFMGILSFVMMAPVVYSILYFPDEMYIIAGQEQEFTYKLPIGAEISASEAIQVNNEPVKENIQISLQEPFTVASETTGQVDMKLSLFGVIPLKTVKVSVLPELEIVPCGITIGVKVNTEGVLVLGTGYVNGEDGQEHEPSKGALKSGDLILAVNGTAIHSKEELVRTIEERGNDGELSFTVKRNEAEFDTTVMPVKSKEDQKPKIGVWVRDSTQGIGTMTYYSPATGTFGALGHGIMDVDTKELMQIEGGTVMQSSITDIKKGKKGTPGELIGSIESGHTYGSISANTSLGVFGQLEELPSSIAYESLPIALKNDIQEGPATILSNVQGDTIEEYAVEIVSVNRITKDDAKGMIIKITDERLLDKTNGIVQGMSGSPIIQNGKIIGAVTHVFVQNPAQGYGIFIENMLKEELNIAIK